MAVMLLPLHTDLVKCVVRCQAMRKQKTYAWLATGEGQRTSRCEDAKSRHKCAANPLKAGLLAESQIAVGRLKRRAGQPA